MKTQTFTLDAFNGKATIVQTTSDENITVSRLFSYDTNVATYDHKDNIMTVNGWYSSTTARHINAFLEFYGFDKCTKKQLENYNK